MYLLLIKNSSKSLKGELLELLGSAGISPRVRHTCGRPALRVPNEGRKEWLYGTQIRQHVEKILSQRRAS